MWEQVESFQDNLQPPLCLSVCLPVGFRLSCCGFGRSQSKCSSAVRVLQLRRCSGLPLHPSLRPLPLLLEPQKCRGLVLWKSGHRTEDLPAGLMSGIWV